MSNNFEIEQQIEQKLSITPKMIQRISILSSTSAELGEMITNELENNPALEEKSPESEEFKTENYENEYKENYQEKIISKKINFHEFLENQVGELKVSSKQKILLKELIHNINQNGYFPSDFNLKEIAEENKISTEILAEGIKILQNLEPSGIAARNITECLNIQIEHLQDNMYPKKIIQIAKKLIKNNLEILKRRSLKSIAKEFRVSVEEIQKSIELIKKLKINPAEDFVEYEEELKIPDIFVSIKNEKMNVKLNEEKFKTDGIKPLVCNQEYVEISKELGKLDRKDQKHIKEKLGQAKDFIESVRNWKETLLRVGTVIAKNQNNFFKNGIQEIKPLKLEDISHETGLHISTISRTINGKYLETPSNEVLSLRYFFHNSIQKISGEEISTRYIQNMISELINKEDKIKPLSDQKISLLLLEMGIPISRRTVSKYRENLKILSSIKRTEKKY
tara:strand:+ start:100 stop:1455 length:1356 start_codon:yes stop_codon:yes gene_type:complete